MTKSPSRPLAWREANTITDWEFARIGELLCDHEPRDLALKIVRLEGQVEARQMLTERRADKPDRIDCDGRGDLDEIVLNDVSMFRMERMNDGYFWIKCYREDKPDVVFNLNAKGKITGRHRFE